MLEPFKGELFIHPAALDYSGNLCSNNCAYCFASLRTQDRRASVKKLIDLCLGKSSGKSMTDWLFNQGYPVCVSNKSDPFAATNWDNTPQIFEALDYAPNGVFIQTKGGKDDMKICDGLKKENVVMYITISTLDEKISRRVEPGAPLPKHRIELAKYAKARGWEVIIGINPCTKAWMPEADLIALEDELLAAGIDRYLIMPLSLNSKDVAGMCAARRAMLDDATVEAAVKHTDDHFHWRDQYRRMNRRGLHAYSVQGPLPCHMDELACKRLGKHINSVQHFTDYGWDEHARSGKTIFKFEDFLRTMTEGNPEMLTYRHVDCYKYIMCVNRALWKAGGLAKTAKSFVDVYRVLWNAGSLAHSPQNLWCFTKLITADGKPLRDYNGDIQLAFLGGGPIPSRDRKAAMTVDDLKGKGVNCDEAYS